MKTKGKKLLPLLLCACLSAVSVNGQKIIEDFESYAADDELMGAWFPQGSTISLSDAVATGSSGKKSLRVERYFPSSTWETEVISGPPLTEPMVIAPNQYITLRVAGDPQFTNATFQTLFLYVWDGENRWGRWGSQVPTSTNWQIFNYLASSVQKPWDSPALPDLSNIVQFKLYLYGQGDPPGAEYSATVYVDDITVRDTPLVEFPPPAPMRSLIDDFEGYADDTALMGFYSYVNSPAATATTAALSSPAPQGSKALKLSIDFAPGQWPWGSVRSPLQTPFSIPTNAVVQVRLKGDPVLAPVADNGTTFWLTFYDQGGRAMNFSTVTGVTTSEWTTLTATYDDFWTTTPVDNGNLVQWRILVEGWTGTAESQPLSGTFYVDDIRVSIPPASPPVLSILQAGTSLTLKMDSLVPGTTYTVRKTEDFTQWTNETTVQAAGTSATWPIPAGQKGYFQLAY